MTTSFWTQLFDLLSPRRCLECGERLSATETVLCPACMLQLPLTHYSRNALDNPLARLFWGLIPIERASALFFYEPQTLTARIIHAIKYYGRSDVAEEMGLMLARELVADNFFEGIDGIVPVPLTKGRQRKRGYNQSELIARSISRITGLPIHRKLLERVNFTDSQTHHNSYERRENVCNAFRLRSEGGNTHATSGAASSFEGKHLLLVDDVVTTGNTLLACATALMQIPDIKISIAVLGYSKN